MNIPQKRLVYGGQVTLNTGKRRLVAVDKG